VPKVLIVTNDFPPRRGGIQSFVHALALRMEPDSVVVYAPRWEGAAEFDARQPFPVIRHPTSLMLPVPSVSRRAARLLREHGCDTVLFGAAAPLGLLTPSLRRAGARRVVGITHGHEAGWAALPGTRWLLRRIGDQVDVLTYLGEYFRVRLARALSPAAAARMVRLAPGVDNAEFRPGVGGEQIRQRLGLGQRPVVVCVSRMVPRKGQDTLIRAWPQVLAALRARATAGSGREPGAASSGREERVAGDPVLLLVGDGPYRTELGRPARPLRRGGRFRDALPHASPGPGCRRARHRLSGGLGYRSAGDQRGLRWRAGRRARRRDRLRSARQRRGRPCDQDHRAAGRPRGRGRDGGEGRRLDRPGVALGDRTRAGSGYAFCCE
jgi:phosphatidylinositol alpha-1,6-mannosyltransferase